MHTKNS